MRSIRLVSATVYRRSAATFVDWAVVTGVVCLFWVAGVLPTGIYAAPADRFLADHLFGLWIAHPGAFVNPVLVWTLVWVLWHFSWVYLASGQTPGCRLLRLRVLDRHANPVRWKHVALRCLGHFLSVLTLGLGWAWVWVSSERRSWPDILSGTYLVAER